MSKKQSVNVMVDGGAATAGPPLGPALGPMGVNAGKVVQDINKATESFKGMKIPVEVIVDSGTKEYEIVVGTPPTSALLIKAAGVEKAGGAKETVADLGFEQILEIAKSKRSALLSKTLKSAVKEIAGACQSLRFTINGLTPKELIAQVNEGKFDSEISS